MISCHLNGVSLFNSDSFIQFFFVQSGLSDFHKEYVTEFLVATTV